ncbi:MAG: rod shape-determining protein MreC [Elusimicrobia bacterium]|nr:rod shape-determining protein MreC [Elusimicrobiota bacterium]
MSREKDVVNYAAVFFISIACLLLIFPSAGIVHKIRLICSYSFYPSLHYGAKYDYYLRNVPENFVRVLKTDQDNRRLEQKIKEMEILVNRANALAQENERLVRITGISAGLSWQGSWARVTGKNPHDWYGFFFVDKGSNDGVPLHAAAIAVEDGKAGLVGRIFEVYPEFSKVMLITNPISSVISSVGDRGFESLIEGKGTWLLKLNYVSEEAQISEGMEIFTSPSSMLFPAGISIGRINRVYQRESSMNFASADVAPTVNIGAVREVFIITRGLPDRFRKLIEEGI